MLWEENPFGHCKMHNVVHIRNTNWGPEHSFGVYFQIISIKKMGEKSIIIYKKIRLATGWKQQQYCRNITGKGHWGHFKYNSNHKMMAGVLIWNMRAVMRCEIREEVSVTWMSSLTAILEIMAIRPCNSVKTKTTTKKHWLPEPHMFDTYKFHKQEWVTHT